MAKETDQQYLDRVFGTHILGRCNSCNFAKRNVSSNISGSNYSGKTYYRFSCGSDTCIMVTSLEWRKKKELAELSKKAGNSKGGIINLIQKSNFAGIVNEYITGNWVIRYSEETVDELGNSKRSKMWFNSKSGAAGKTVYREIVIFGDMIACWKGAVPENIEVYSTQCSEVNLASGINLHFDTSIKTIPVRDGISIIVGYTIDNSTGKNMSILISPLGNIVTFPKCQIDWIDLTQDGILVQLESKMFIRLDKHFNILTKSKQMIALKLK